jgi:hypothetical protein
MKIVSTWREMLPKLITKYHDGYRAITDGTLPAVEMQRLFYPAWWLKAVGFFNSGINTGPGVIMFAPNPLGASSGSGGWAMALLLTAAASSALSFCVAYVLFSKGGSARLLGGERDEVTVALHTSSSSASSLKGAASVPLSYQSQLLQPSSGSGKSTGRQYASGDIQLASVSASASTSADGKRSTSATASATTKPRRTEYMSLDV